MDLWKICNFQYSFNVVSKNNIKMELDDLIELKTILNSKSNEYWYLNAENLVLWKSFSMHFWLMLINCATFTVKNIYTLAKKAKINNECLTKNSSCSIKLKYRKVR